MEPSKTETINPNKLYIEAAKGARIYDLILDNKNYDGIEDSQIETQELNDMNFNKFFNYIDKLKAKNDGTVNKINEVSHYVKSAIKVIINGISLGSSQIEITHYLLRLSAFYYLFKLYFSKDIILKNLYINKIDEIIDTFFQGKTYYYNILVFLDYIKDMDNILMKNRKDIFDTYWKIIFFLDEKMFFNLVGNYMVNKKSKYPQYSIQLPLFSFAFENLCEKMKELNNILYILAKTETFKTNERFEYFYAFRYKHELLDQINYVLDKQEKKPLICLDKITDDIAEEAIKFSFLTIDNTQQKDDLISELQRLIEVGKKNQKEMIIQYNELDRKYSTYKKNYESLIQTNSKNVAELELKMKEIQKKYTEQNKKINEQKEKINLLNKDKDKKEEIIERISYREIGSRIIQFFSLSQSEEKLLEYKKKDISSKNINKIISNIKDILPYYYKYLKDNQVDLKYVLNEIKSEKNNYNSLVHDTEKFKEKYLELMAKRDKKLGKEIDFLFSNSKLMHRYVFEKDKNISDKEIYQEFLDVDKELKMKFQGSKKDEEAKNNIDNF